MRKYFLPVAGALLFLSLRPASANIINGTFAGSVTETSGASIPFSVGAPVDGFFSYDPDLLSLDSAGNRWTGVADPAASFLVNINGQPFAGYTALLWGLTFSVDANGAPVTGNSPGAWDLGINHGTLGLVYFMGGEHLHAQVTYAVPDAGTTACLLGLALAGVGVARRCLR